MPLWMVLTKWPAPSGPISAAQGSPSNLAEMSSRIFSTRRHAWLVPPAMIEGPWRAPTSPPETPMPRNSKPLRAELRHAPLGVAEIGVAGVDQHVALDQLAADLVGLLVDRRTGHHHDDDRARRGDRRSQLLDRLARDQPLGERAGMGHEGVDLRRRTVVNGDRVALFGHVEGEVGAHHSETDETDIRHGVVLLLVCARFVGRRVADRLGAGGRHTMKDRAGGPCLQAG